LKSVVKTRTLRQSAVFKATPHEVYEMLMDSKKHSAFTGTKAKISAKVGGKFTAYDGDIDGRNVKLVANKLIVQTWRESQWPKNHYSTVTYKLEKNGSGTKLTFMQKDVPASFAADISEGWKEYYWSRMKEYLNE